MENENEAKNETKRDNFVRYMSNPRSFTLKKWFIELLKEEYPPFDAIVERIATSLITDKDLKDFGQLVTHIYAKAYRKAVEDYRKEIEKLGLKINITEEVAN
jgi:hypothetical protein